MSTGEGETEQHTPGAHIGCAPAVVASDGPRALNRCHGRPVHTRNSDPVGKADAVGQGVPGCGGPGGTVCPVGDPDQIARR